jgi:lipopolysaccharide O-acetyltransferase
MYLSSLARRYGVLGFIRLVRDTLLTRIITPQARLIRYPYYIRGKTYIQIGKEFTSGVGLRMDAFGTRKHQILIGDRVQLGDYCHIGAIESIVIGDDVLIASKVFISDHNHGNYGVGSDTSPPNTTPYSRPLSSSAINIEKNVWIGESVHILAGVTVGEGSVIGAGSVVTRSVPPYSIAAGSPARVIKEYDFSGKRWIKVSESGI